MFFNQCHWSVCIVSRYNTVMEYVTSWHDTNQVWSRRHKMCHVAPESEPGDSAEFCCNAIIMLQHCKVTCHAQPPLRQTEEKGHFLGLESECWRTGLVRFSWIIVLQSVVYFFHYQLEEKVEGTLNYCEKNCIGTKYGATEQRYFVCKSSISWKPNNEMETRGFSSNWIIITKEG